MFNDKDLTLQMWAECIRQGDLARLHLLFKLKHLHKKGIQTINYRGNLCYRSTDAAGGFLHVCDLKETAQLLGISYNTLRQRLSELKKRGWVKRTEKGWRFVTWRRIVKKYCPYINKIKYFAPTTLELKKLIAFKIIERSLNQQVFAKYGNSNSKNWLKNNAQAISRDAEFSMSCRILASKMGFKSGMTGCRYEHRLKRDRLLQVKRRNLVICKANTLPFLLEGDPELCKRVFIKGDLVYQRLCNNLYIPMQKAA